MKILKSSLTFVTILAICGLFLISCGNGTNDSNSSTTDTPAKINTVWQEKSMTISGQIVSYKFGDGNPSQVALKREEYKSTGEGNGPYATTNIGVDYVTPEIENLLYSILSNQTLALVLNSCNLTKNSPLPGSEYFSMSELDINKLMYIDAKTGRKTINSAPIYALLNALQEIDRQIKDKTGTYASCIPANQIINFKDLYSDVDSLLGEYDAVFRDSI